MVSQTIPTRMAVRLETALAAMRRPDLEPEALVETLCDISVIAQEGVRAIRKARAIEASGQYQEDGHTLLAAAVWMDGVICDVLAMQKPDGYRSYLIKADLATGGEGPKVVIGSCDRAPNTGTLCDILIKAGLLDDEAPGFTGEEWAINVNGRNPSNSNFAHEALRDCAVDELILDKGSDQVGRLALFALDRSGDEDDESYPDPETWAQERNLPTTAASVLRDERAEVPR